MSFTCEFKRKRNWFSQKLWLKMCTYTIYWHPGVPSLYSSVGVMPENTHVGDDLKCINICLFDMSCVDFKIWVSGWLYTSELPSEIDFVVLTSVFLYNSRTFLRLRIEERKYHAGDSRIIFRRSSCKILFRGSHSKIEANAPVDRALYSLYLIFIEK